MFQSGSPVHGKNFLDRKEHLPLFKTYLDNNQNIMIKAPRRYGKTSLVLHLFELYQYPKIYIDIKRNNSLTKISEQIINEVYKYAGIEKIIPKTKESISKLFKVFKTSLKIDIEIAELTIETLEDFDKNNIDEVELFLYALDLVNNIALKQNLNIKFAFDEFQDILNITDKTILDKIRSTIQHHENVTYIFLGSIESIMNQIFSSKSSPFFHFARIIELGGFNIDEIEIFVKQFFKDKKLRYNNLINQVLGYLEGHPYYTIKFLQTIYFKTLEKSLNVISNKDLEDALIIVFFETRLYIEEIIEKIKQKKHHYYVIYNLANNKEQNLDSTSLYKTYKSLENMGYVKNIDRGTYIITDIFLKLYLQQNSDIEFIEGKIKFLDLGLGD